MSATTDNPLFLDQLLHAIDDSDHLRSHSVWGEAVRTAARESLHVLLAAGALSDDSSLDLSIERVAKVFGYAETSQALSAAIDELPVEHRLKIDGLCNQAEFEKWHGAYALGLAVGLRLAGGAR